jgi:hypothetical protein
MTVTPVHTQASVAAGFAVVVNARILDDDSEVTVKTCGAVLVKDCLLDAVDRHSSQVRPSAQHHR